MKIQNIDDGKVYKVYGTRFDGVLTYFLIWYYEEWLWVGADEYEPWGG